MMTERYLPKLNAVMYLVIAVIIAITVWQNVSEGLLKIKGPPKRIEIPEALLSTYTQTSEAMPGGNVFDANSQNWQGSGVRVPVVPSALPQSISGFVRIEGGDTGVFTDDDYTPVGEYVNDKKVRGIEKNRTILLQDPVGRVESVLINPNREKRVNSLDIHVGE